MEKLHLLKHWLKWRILKKTMHFGWLGFGLLWNTSHCFSRFSLIRAQNWVPFVFLDSLFSKKYSSKVSIFFSIGWTSWEPVQQVAWWRPCFINALHCFNRLSLIRAQNWVPFILLDFLFSEEYSGKVSDLFSIGWANWEPIQPVLLGSSSFSVFWPPFLLWFRHLGSKALVGHLWVWIQIWFELMSAHLWFKGIIG